MSFPHLLWTALAGCLAAGLVAQDGVSGGFYPDRILVKLHEESGAVLEAGLLESRNGSDLDACRDLFQQAARTERAIDQPLEVLDLWYSEADELLPQGITRPGHLGLWFRLTLEDPAEMAEMLTQLAGERWVEEVEQELVPVLFSQGSALPEDDIPPVTPDLRALQGYVQDAPSGFGFESAKRVAGARGQTVRLYHVESAWRVDHEDLPSVGAEDFLTDRMVDPLRPTIEHGTAVLGIWVAGQNGFGMTGVADAAEVRLISQNLIGGIGNGIAMAIADGRRGDVLALILGYNLQQVDAADMIPAEYSRLDFDAVATAVSRGFIMVEAAGNGDSDLDDPRFHLRFDRSFRDSGAIMVGATGDGPLVRSPFSNYGSRVDCNAWGEGVGTVGHGTWMAVGGDDRQRYTERGAGTSAATALLAGVVAQVCGAARLQDDRILSPLEVRTLVSSYGTAIPAGQIGVRPDVPAILAALGLPDGLDTARHEVQIGESIELQISGSPNGLAILGGSWAWERSDVGLGRDLLLDLDYLSVIGLSLDANGEASWTVPVPPWVELRGLGAFFQARLIGDDSDRLSSAVEVFVGYQ